MKKTFLQYYENLKNLSKKHFPTSKLFLSMVLIYAVIMCIFLPIILNSTKTEYDGNDLLTALLTVQISLIAFVIPLFLQMIYTLADKISPYSELYIDYSVSYIKTEQKIYYGMFITIFLIILFVWCSVFGSKDLNIYDVRFRHIAEILCIFLVFFNICDVTHSIIEFQKRTKKSFEYDDNFLKFLHQKIIDNPNAMKLVLAGKNAEYRQVYDYIPNLLILNIIPNLLDKFTNFSDIKGKEFKGKEFIFYHFLDVYKKSTMTKEELDKKFNIFFTQIENRYFKRSGYKEIEYDTLKQLYHAIFYVYEQSIYDGLETIADQCLDFFIFYFNESEIIINNHLGNKSTEQRVCNYEDSNNYKNVLFIYDYTISMMPYFSILSRLLKEENPKTSELYEKHIEKIKRTVLNSNSSDKFYVESFIRRFFLLENLEYKGSLHRKSYSFILENSKMNKRYSEHRAASLRVRNEHILNELDIICLMENDPFSILNKEYCPNGDAYIKILLSQGSTKIMSNTASTLLDLCEQNKFFDKTQNLQSFLTQLNNFHAPDTD